MTKRIIASVLLALLSPVVSAQFIEPILALDTLNNRALPKNFRTAQDSLPFYSFVDTTGLSSLPIAGSAEFSENGLLEAMRRLPTNDVVVVDLRQESHGYIDGTAVCLYGPSNAANAGKTGAEIEKDQKTLLMDLSHQSQTTVYKIESKTQKGEVDEASQFSLPVSNIQSENQMTESYRLKYQRFYVADFHAPDADEANRFVRFVRKLPASTWLYFHCRAGRGRTTTFMAMYDMLKNANKVSFEDIMARQAALGGEDLTVLPSPKSYKYQAAVERLAFLKHFYDYAKANPLLTR